MPRSAELSTAGGTSSTGAAVRDEARLAALWRTGLLDTPPEEVFDRLTRLARRLLGAPVVLISLVDADRQFFKSALGLPEPWASRRETPLSHSFCQHVVATGAPLRVEDARHDPLVCDNLAVPELGVVAYLGMPLATADGQVLGSLCAIDTEPRSWTAEDAAALRDLAALAMSEMSLRGLAIELEAWLRQEEAGREAAQARLAQARLARSRRLEALGEMAGGVAHDFANVLQAVQGGVRLAAGRLDRDPASARHLLEMVGGATARGASVTRRLLAFARQGEPEPGRADTAALVEGLDEVLAHAMGVPGLRVRVEAEPDLPAVLADSGQLESALVNLAAKARDDAMPEGGTLTVAVAAEVIAEGGVPHPAGLGTGRYVRFSVEGSDVGLVAGTPARPVAPFPATKPGVEGTGLGLVTAREFARQAGGGLAVVSEPGRRTRAVLWLPSADQTEAPARRAPPVGEA